MAEGPRESAPSDLRPLLPERMRYRLRHLNIKDVEMAIEDRETFNLIGSDMVEGRNEYGPDGQKSVTSSVS